LEAGKSWREISEGLPGRTFYATKKRGHALGLKHGEAGAPWTAAEDATLRAGVEAGEPWKTIAEKLPGRKWTMARDRAKVLGIERSEGRLHVAWTEAEDEEIRAGVEAGERWETIAEKLPGRKWTMARDRARWLGIERSEKQVQIAWTEAEDEEIRAGIAAGETTEAIAKRLPGRTLNAVGIRRIRLGEGGHRVVERWTEAEDAALREGFKSGKTWKDIAGGLPVGPDGAAATRVLRGLGRERDDPSGSP
jgi:hypothetical protein